MITTGFFPLAGAVACEFDANANIRADTNAAGKIHQHMQFIHLFNNDVDVFPHLLR